jgi:YrhK-like protein
LIGHALAIAPRRVSREVWDRAIAVGFAVGSACFFIGPFPGFVELVGVGADGVVFFAGSVFFTLAAALELREGTLRLGRWASDPSWWSAAIQFVGTLLFNVDTFDAMQSSLSSEQEDRLVFAPDLVGSACFLVSGLLAYRVAAGPRLLHPATRDRSWRMAAVNLVGCIFFMISAIASYVVPSSGSMLDLAAANWTTGLGALCFFIGALMLLPRSDAKASQHVHQPREV